MSVQIEGVYSLTGIHEVAAAFKFEADGSFEFFFAYGVSDRNARGSFIVEDKKIILRSDKEPGKDFKVVKQMKHGSGFQIKVLDAPNPFLLHNVLCLVKNEGEEDAGFWSDAKGVINIETAKADQLFLQHGVFKDIFTPVKDKDNHNNYFEVTLETSLGQVSFKGIDLFIEEDGSLSCYPNYFMPFKNIRFVKQEA